MVPARCPTSGNSSSQRFGSPGKRQRAPSPAHAEILTAGTKTVFISQPRPERKTAHANIFECVGSSIIRLWWYVRLLTDHLYLGSHKTRHRLPLKELLITILVQGQRMENIMSFLGAYYLHHKHPKRKVLNEADTCWIAACALPRW